MRIIAGEFKNRKISFPKSKLVRPTTERNKESIFSYLENKLDFSEKIVLDLYAGSGSLGLEALSRGAEEVHFVENNYTVYKNLLNTISLLNVSERTKTFKMTCKKFSDICEESKYHLILADPPFFRYDIYQVVNNLINNSILKQNGILIIERSIQTEKEDKLYFKQDPIKKLGDSLIYEYIFS